MKYIVTFWILAIPIVMCAQLTRTLHQSFDMGEINKVVMQLKDSIVVLPWEGNTVMSESRIYIENTEPRILDGFIREGRYRLIGEKKGDGIVIIPAINRKKIRTKEGLDMNELVILNIYVPKTVQVVGVDGLVIPPSGEGSTDAVVAPVGLSADEMRKDSIFQGLLTPEGLPINNTKSSKSKSKGKKKRTN